jgi:LysM repeat protein
MRQITCPFLGQADDPTTALGFPSEGNYCHNARPIAVINLEHQQHYCLTPKHTACPVYQYAHPQRMPAALAAPAHRRKHNRRILAIFAIPLLVILLFSLPLIGSNLQTWLKANTLLIPQTGEIIVDDVTEQASLFQYGQSTLTPFLPNTATVSPVPLIANCDLPANWMTYIVNPTDSLFRLSVIFNIPIEVLQQVNCMGDNTVILPGQILYVPFVPTKTPTSTPSPTFPIVGLSATRIPAMRAQPAVLPTSTQRPTSIPTPVPTTAVVDEPTREPQASETVVPTETLAPTATLPPPSPTPTVAPSEIPTETLVPIPTELPTEIPTITLAPTPTEEPVVIPTETEVPLPTQAPTEAPTETIVPTPSNEVPTDIPTEVPTAVPTEVPTVVPTEALVPVPTEVPTQIPTISTTETLVPVPTEEPTKVPIQISTGTSIPVETELPIATEAPALTPTVSKERTETIAPTETEEPENPVETITPEDKDIDPKETPSAEQEPN